jgi:hypothetical protein
MKINWGISVAIVYTLFAVGMILFVVKASQQKNDLVTENYYDEAIHYQDKIDAMGNARLLTNSFTATFSKPTNSILISINNKEGAINGKINFYKPDNASLDFEVVLITDSSGVQRISAENKAKGLWNVLASWQVGEKKYYSESKLFIQ